MARSGTNEGILNDYFVKSSREATKSRPPFLLEVLEVRPSVVHARVRQGEANRVAATFLDHEAASANRTNRHSHLAAVIDVALSVAPLALVLTHFSPRYEKEQIVTRLTAEASARRVPFPIWAIGPAELVRDVFRTVPAWQP